MQPESKKRLEEFVKRAEYIRGLSYLDDGENIVGGQIAEVDGKLQVNFYQPKNETRDALLLNLRLFVQDKDDISLRRMAELYDDPDISHAWKHEHEKVRDQLKTQLSQVAANGSKGSITFDDVFRMFLFGEIGHFDQDDRAYQLFQKWVTNKTEWEILHNTFHDTLIWVLGAIINIAAACNDELKRAEEAQK